MGKRKKAINIYKAVTIMHAVILEISFEVTLLHTPGSQEICIPDGV